jgi:tRNAHis guanylyltransferase
MLEIICNCLAAMAQQKAVRGQLCCRAGDHSTAGSAAPMQGGDKFINHNALFASTPFCRLLEYPCARSVIPHVPIAVRRSCGWCDGHSNCTATIEGQCCLIKMANSKYSYVKKFELDDRLLPNCWIVVRLDGKGFTKCAECAASQRTCDSTLNKVVCSCESSETRGEQTVDDVQVLCPPRVREAK